MFCLPSGRVAADLRGNVMIEFALGLPILFLLMAGLLDLGTFAVQKSSMLQGAREGAQYGMMAYSGLTSVSTTLSNNVNNTAQNATGLTGVTATNSMFCECVAGTSVSCSTTCATGTLKRYITVTATKTFTSILSVSTLSFGSFGSWTPPTSVTASVTMTVP